MTVEQLGEALKQVQEAVIKGICEHMKAPNSQPGAELGSAFAGSARQTGGAGQPLQRASVNIAIQISCYPLRVWRAGGSMVYGARGILSPTLPHAWGSEK